MHIIIIGNYPLDRVESMHRFARLLHHEFNNSGITSEIWQPSVFFGYLTKKRKGRRPNKWFGYADKFLIFPVILFCRMLNKKFYATPIRFHICDHGTAPSLKYLPKDRTIITCHDVHAIRGALGYSDSYTPASFFGKLFQKWIHHHLNRSKYLIAVSHQTLKQLQEIKPVGKVHQTEQNWRVVHNGFNSKFRIIGLSEQQTQLARAGMDPKVSYILHVGSNSLRKNRKLLIEMLKALKGKWNGKVCFAGDPIDDSLIDYAKSLGCMDDVISVAYPDHNTLVALYNAADAFIFPSYSEGFGWPLIEAQACGTPVIASNVAPIPEVGGYGATYVDPNVPEEFAETFLMFRNDDYRALMIRKGLENAKRFNSQFMIDAYLSFHKNNAPELERCVVEDRYGGCSH
jgi:glycosyltransferase involved in cell wall biosynthesis